MVEVRLLMVERGGWCRVLQDPDTFNGLVGRFLDYEVDCSASKPVKGP